MVTLEAAGTGGREIEQEGLSMTKSFAFAKGAAAAIAGVAMLGAATAASAQPYQGYGAYNPCQRDANSRGVAGALIGGAGGAVLGSQFAANGHRSDGSLLGGIVGALAGAAVGHSSAACTDAPPPPPPSGANEAPPPPPAPPQLSYNDGGPAPDPSAYDGPPPARYAERGGVWVYGRHGVRYRVVEERAGRDGCTYAESPVYMPDGRVEHSFVHVCPDYRGRYHIVD
jgi:hypothetical protein